jgi:Skp family chaperone for outer membrane proteins
MNKEDIKSLLREALGMQRPMESMVPEAEGNEDEKGDKNYDELNGKQKKKVQTLTKKIKNATQGAGKLLKLSQVMDAAGVGDADNATDRSAIGKAVSGKPDADGKIRHLTIKQANDMGDVVDNPTAFK